MNAAAAMDAGSWPDCMALSPIVPEDSVRPKLSFPLVTGEPAIDLKQGVDMSAEFGSFDERRHQNAPIEKLEHAWQFPHRMSDIAWQGPSEILGQLTRRDHASVIDQSPHDTPIKVRISGGPSSTYQLQAEADTDTAHAGSETDTAFPTACDQQRHEPAAQQASPATSPHSTPAQVDADMTMHGTDKLTQDYMSTGTSANPSEHVATPLNQSPVERLLDFLVTPCNVPTAHSTPGSSSSSREDASASGSPAIQQQCPSARAVDYTPSLLLTSTPLPRNRTVRPVGHMLRGVRQEQQEQESPSATWLVSPGSISGNRQARRQQEEQQPQEEEEQHGHDEQQREGEQSLLLQQQDEEEQQQWERQQQQQEGYWLQHHEEEEVQQQQQPQQQGQQQEGHRWLQQQEGKEEQQQQEQQEGGQWLQQQQEKEQQQQLPGSRRLTQLSWASTDLQEDPAVSQEASMQDAIFSDAGSGSELPACSEEGSAPVSPATANSPSLGAAHARHGQEQQQQQRPDVAWAVLWASTTSSLMSFAAAGSRQLEDLSWQQLSPLLQPDGDEGCVQEPRQGMEVGSTCSPAAVVVDAALGSFQDGGEDEDEDEDAAGLRELLPSMPSPTTDGSFEGEPGVASSPQDSLEQLPPVLVSMGDSQQAHVTLQPVSSTDSLDENSSTRKATVAVARAMARVNQLSREKQMLQHSLDKALQAGAAATAHQEAHLAVLVSQLNDSEGARAALQAELAQQSHDMGRQLREALELARFADEEASAQRQRAIEAERSNHYLQQSAASAAAAAERLLLPGRQHGEAQSLQALQERVADLEDELDVAHSGCRSLAVQAKDHAALQERLRSQLAARDAEIQELQSHLALATAIGVAPSTPISVGPLRTPHGGIGSGRSMGITPGSMPGLAADPSVQLLELKYSMQQLVQVAEQLAGSFPGLHHGGQARQEPMATVAACMQHAVVLHGPELSAGRDSYGAGWARETLSQLIAQCSAIACKLSACINAVRADNAVVPLDPTTISPFTEHASAVVEAVAEQAEVQEEASQQGLQQGLVPVGPQDRQLHMLPDCLLHITERCQQLESALALQQACAQEAEQKVQEAMKGLEAAAETAGQYQAAAEQNLQWHDQAEVLPQAAGSGSSGHGEGASAPVVLQIQIVEDGPQLSEMQQLLDELSLINEQAVGKIQALRAERVMLQARLEASQASAAELTSERDMLQAQLQQLEVSVNDLKTEAFASAEANVLLRQQLTTAKEQLAGAVTALEGMVPELAAAKDVQAVLLQEREAMQEQVEEAERKGQELYDVSILYGTRSVAVEEAFTAQVAALRVELEQAREVIHGLHEEAKGLEQQCLDAKTALQAAKLSSAQEAEAKLQLEHAAAWRVEREELVTQLRSASHAESALQRGMQDLSRQLVQLRQQWEEQRAQAAAVSLEGFTAMQAEVGRLRGEREQLQGELREAHRSGAALQREAMELAEQLESVRSEREEQEVRAAATIQELQVELGEQEVNAAGATEQLGAVRLEKEEQQVRAAKAIQELEGQVALLQAELGEQEVRAGGVTEKLQETLAALQVEREEQEARGMEAAQKREDMLAAQQAENEPGEVLALQAQLQLQEVRGMEAVQKLEAQVEALHTELEVQAADAREAVQKVKAAAKKLQAEVVLLEAALAGARQAADSSEAAASVAKKQLAQAEVEVETLSAEVQAKYRAVAEAEGAAKMAAGALARMQDAFVRVVDENSVLAEAAARAARDAAGEEVRAASAVLAQAQADAAAESVRLRDRLRGLEARALQLREERHELQQRLAAAEQVAADAQAVAAEAEQRELAAGKAHAAEVAALRMRMQEYERQRASQEQCLVAGLTAEVSRLQADLDEAESKLEVSQAGLSYGIQTASPASVKGGEQNRDHSGQELVGTRSGEADWLRQRCDEYQDEVHLLKEQLREAEQRAATYHAANEHLERSHAMRDSKPEHAWLEQGSGLSVGTEMQAWLCRSGSEHTRGNAEVSVSAAHLSEEERRLLRQLWEMLTQDAQAARARSMRRQEKAAQRRQKAGQKNDGIGSGNRQDPDAKAQAASSDVSEEPSQRQLQFLYGEQRQGLSWDSDEAGMQLAVRPEGNLINPPVQTGAAWAGRDAGHVGRADQGGAAGHAQLLAQVVHRMRELREQNRQMAKLLWHMEKDSRLMARLDELHRENTDLVSRCTAMQAAQQQYERTVRRLSAENTELAALVMGSEDSKAY